MDADDTETSKDAPDGTSPTGMSPYATGGGGVSFERQVAVTYLVHLLVGDGAIELGDGRLISSVAFQQAPAPGRPSIDDHFQRDEPAILVNGAGWRRLRVHDAAHE